MDRITLFIFGGVAHMRREPDRARDELLIAIVGPLTSIGLGFIFTLLGTALAFDSLAQVDVAEEAMRRLGPATTALLWLGPINILLGLFNLIPGFPLDGGRVLRALIWWATGDLGRATHWASRAGRLIAWAMMGFGAFLFVGGKPLQGLWLVLIGWFLNNAALLSYQQHVTRVALTGVPVSQVMRHAFDAVSPRTTIAGVVEQLLRGSQRAFPVLVSGELVGIVCLADVRRVPRERWSDVVVEDVMTLVDDVSVIDPDAPAFEALQQLGAHEVNQLPVIDRSGELVGIIIREDVVRWLALRSELTRAYRN